MCLRCNRLAHQWWEPKKRETCVRVVFHLCDGTQPVQDKKNLPELKAVNFPKVKRKFNIPKCCSGSWPGPPCAGGGVSFVCPPPAPAPAWLSSAPPSGWPLSAGLAREDASAHFPRSKWITFRHYSHYSVLVYTRQKTFAGSVIMQYNKQLKNCKCWFLFVSFVSLVTSLCKLTSNICNRSTT